MKITAYGKTENWTIYAICELRDSEKKMKEARRGYKRTRLLAKGGRILILARGKRWTRRRR